jgi:cytidylate kinase
MIKVITIDREYGSGGSVIAEKLAAQRGWTLWDQNLTCEIAKHARCERSVVERREERKDSLYYRLLKSFIRGGFEGSLNAEPLLEVVDTDALIQVTQKLVRRAAAEGNCVIVGRGSAYFLQDVPDAFHVFVYSTKADKMRRLRRQGKSSDEASNLIETIDRERAAFIKHYHGKCWPDRYLFDMMVNAAGGEDVAVQVIQGAVGIHEAHHLDKTVLTEAGTQCVKESAIP